MAERTQLNPGWKWSREVPFSQGVRVGDTIHVSGMVALDAEGELQWPRAVGEYPGCLGLGASRSTPAAVASGHHMQPDSPTTGRVCSLPGKM